MPSRPVRAWRSACGVPHRRAGAALVAAAALGALCIGDPAAASPPGEAAPQSAGLQAKLPEAYRYDGVLAVAPSSRPDGPRGLDVADDGLIYVAESRGGRVSVWHPDGGTDPDLAGPGSEPGSLVAPEDVAVSADGRTVYVADPAAVRVQVYERRSGAHAGSWAEVGVPRGIAAGPDGRVYVSDADGHRIAVRDRDGGVIDWWGGPGTGPGRFDTPLGLAVAPDGTILVADSGNQRIQRLAADGVPLGAIGLDNIGGPGGTPHDVAADADTVYVAVDRGILRFRNDRYLGLVAPLEPAPPADCPIPDPCRCREVRPIANNHEGVQRVAASERLGLFFTYAPRLRTFDRINAMPARGFPSVIPWRCTPFEGSGLTRPMRISTADGRAEPVVQGRARALWRASAGSGSALGSPLDPGDDVATTAGGTTLVVSGNQVASTAGVTMTVLDPDMMTRRNRANDRVPDAGWWHTALAAHEGPTGLLVAVLDAGRQRVTLRRFPDGLLIGQLVPNGTRDPFRVLADVAFDARGWLWIAARDGTIWRYDAAGKLKDRRVLAEAGAEGIVALAVDEPLDGYALTARGMVWKVAGADGAPRAAFDAAELAGRGASPGALRDLAVDASGAVLVTDALGEVVHRFVADAPSDEPVPGSACAVDLDKRASPGRIALGESVTVTLTVGGTCPGLGDGLDAVLVVDTGCQMTGRRLASAREAGARLAAALRPDHDRLAIVRFTDEDGGARLLAPLTNDRAALEAVARGLRNECLPPELVPGRGFEGRLSDGLRAGFEALTGAARRPGAARAAIVVSPSRFDSASIFARLAGLPTPFVLDRQHAQWQGHRFGDLGARVFSISLPEEVRAGFPLVVAAQARLPAPAQPGQPEPTPEPDPRAPHPSDDALLASLALPPSGFRIAGDADELPAIVEAIAGELGPRPLFAPLVITDALPANMRLVPGSADPPAELLAGGVLRWRFDVVPLGTTPTMRYRVTPLEAGDHPTNVEAHAAYTDGLGGAGNAPFPVPIVAVAAPIPSATTTTEPSATPPATATSEPTLTPEPTATAPATGTARPPTTRPARVAVYLPRVVNDACQPKQRPVDVALLIDTSSSMNGEKIAAARAAARTFLGLLDLPRDQATIVRFDRTAVMVEPLGGDRARLEASLDRLATAVGTRLDLGLWTAIGAVRERGRARADADPVIVLLTDGRTEGGSEGAAMQAAQLARDVGISLYAIGLGDDAAPEYLAAIAGSPARVHLAPAAADLARVYAQVARAIPCR